MWAQMNSYRTAIARTSPSVPAKYVIETLLPQLKFTSILDWGCGRGRDLRFYKEQGLICAGYDPYYSPGFPVDRYNFVTCSYVLNIINTYSERKYCLQLIKNKLYSGGHLLITIRPLKHIEKNSYKWRPFGDGYIPINFSSTKT